MGCYAKSAETLTESGDEIRVPSNHELFIDGDRSVSQGGHRNPVYVFAGDLSRTDVQRRR